MPDELYEGREDLEALSQLCSELITRYFGKGENVRSLLGAQVLMEDIAYRIPVILGSVEIGRLDRFPDQRKYIDPNLEFLAEDEALCIQAEKRYKENLRLSREKK